MMHRLLRLGWCLALCLWHVEGPAAPGSGQVEAAVRDYLQHHPSLLKQTYEVRGLERLQRYPSCPQVPEVSLLRRDRAWGKANFRIACPTAAPPWLRTIALEIIVTGRHLVLKNSLAAGSVVQATDLEWVQGELSRWSNQGGWVEDASQLIGLEVVRSLQAGSVPRLNDFREPTVIKTGDLVKLSLLGQGFEMVTSGTAMSNAAIGATVRVKLPDGKVLQGKAVSEGRVEAVLD